MNKQVQATLLRLEIDIGQSSSEVVTERVIFKKIAILRSVNCPISGCHYFSTHKAMLERHIKQCDGKTKLKCHQKIYQKIKHDKFVKELIEEKILGENYKPKHATVYWDAETFMQQNDERVTEKTTDVCDHKLAMICFYPNNCNDFYPTTNVIERESDGPDGLKKMVMVFFNILRSIGEAHRLSLNAQFHQGFRKYKEIVHNYMLISKFKAEDQHKARQKYKILK
jgi:hypothetical protein